MSRGNDPAFPISPGDVPYWEPGMTMRDWFATHAPEPLDAKMQLERMIDRNRNPHNDPHKPALRDDNLIRAQLAYRYADAMLSARQQEQSHEA